MPCLYAAYILKYMYASSYCASQKCLSLIAFVVCCMDTTALAVLWLKPLNFANRKIDCGMYIIYMYSNNVSPKVCMIQVHVMLKEIIE